MLAYAAQNGSVFFDNFKTEIDDHVFTLPDVFREFLDSNWYEHTSDSRDGDMVLKLSIIQKREQLVEFKDMKDPIEEVLKEIIACHAKKLDIDMPGNAVSEYGFNYFKI